MGLAIQVLARDMQRRNTIEVTRTATLLRVLMLVVHGETTYNTDQE